MFRHKKSEEVEAEVDSPSVPPLDKRGLGGVVTTSEEKPKHPQKIVSESDLKELMEKNLKWSQIIYEQNRKINHKLAWAAAAGWLRLFIIVAPIILALWYLPALIGKFQSTISSFTGGLPVSSEGKPTYSIEQLMQLLPLGDAEKAQLKEILK